MKLWHRLARAVVHVAARFVPSTSRDRFVDEWAAELFYEASGRRALAKSLAAR